MSLVGTVVPRHLDGASKILFFRFEDVSIFLSALTLGGMTQHLLLGALSGIVAAALWWRTSALKPRGYALHLLVWYMPLSPFKRQARSYKRHFVG